MLNDSDLGRMAQQLEFMELPVPLLLQREGEVIRHVYFPVEGVASIIASADGARSKVEVGTVGLEGMVGLAVLFGATHAPGDAFMQVGGEGFRMSAAAFSDATSRSPDLSRVLLRYAHSFYVQVSQGAACNRIHSPVQRCARWLLMTRDRVSGDSFELTQEFLGNMLGERRATVNEASSALRQSGLIRYARGKVTILDRPGLQARACPCYGVIRREYDEMAELTM
jgi:CRP-like cAMP-binding protein